MKKTLLICLIAVTAMFGCKKNDDEKTVNKLLGQWKGLTEKETEYVNGQLLREEEPYAYEENELMLEFREKQFEIFEYGKATEEPYTYTVSGNKITYTEDGDTKVVTIKSQTDTNLVLVSEDTEVSGNGITYKEVIERTFVKK